MRMNKVLRQGSYFTLISGIGWCMDFGLYSLLSIYWCVPVAYANMISSLPAITFVFAMATRHIFIRRSGGLKIWQKYVIYLVYQAALVISVSFLAEWVYNIIQDKLLMLCLGKALKVLVKCLITPITMLMNFIVMKILVEKI